jgi:hypothetical protein
MYVLKRLREQMNGITVKWHVIHFVTYMRQKKLLIQEKKYEGMNCVLIHFPDGTVYYPFELMENRYVDVPVFWEELLYFLVVDFNIRQIQILSYDFKKTKRI